MRWQAAERFRFLALLLVGFFPSCAQDIPRTTPEAAVPFRNGIVVSADSLASAVGVSVLKNGGNAVDAAVAVGFALAVTYPEAGNLGGGGFMLLRLAEGAGTVIDFREKAPAAAFREMFLDSTGAEIPGASQTGPLSAGVPGTVAGLLYALDAYGSMDRSAVLNPAIDLAEKGFVVGDRLASSLEDEEAGFSGGALMAFGNGERVVKSGEVLKQADLAAVLRRIERNGAPEFYVGKTAAMIVSAMEPGGGIITLDDLRSYEPIERKPIIGTYRGYTVMTIPPPSFGGIIVLQMLNILENYDVADLGCGSPTVAHLVSSAARFSFHDRFRFAGDPGDVDIPVDRLLSKSLAGERSREVDLYHRAVSWPEIVGHDPMNGETTHFCVADSLGNVAAVTISLNDVYGGKAFVRGAGFFLNNVMDDFSVRAGVPNLYGLTGGESNAVSPGRRMASSMTPTIVLENNVLRFAIGARGGSRIPTGIVQVILNVLDFDLSLTEAVSAPRVHHQWDPDTLYYDLPSMPEGTREELSRLGYNVTQLRFSPARIQAIEAREGLFYGVPDPREGGTAIGF